MRDRRPDDALFSADFASLPYWWERTPRPVLDAGSVPARADVVVIGSGYTGLHTALVTARGGRATLVLDAEDAGFGCSTRNGGQISTSIKPDVDTLAARHGRERALAIHREGHDALRWIGEFIDAESIDCDFRVCGRFHAAHTAREYERLGRRLAGQPPELPLAADLVPRAEQYRELDSDAYHGGVVYHRHAALDPARYHAGLLERVLAAGATVAAHCPVTAVGRDGDGFRVTTSRGTVRAGAVVVASNGYSGAAMPWHRRRVIPIGSYIIATEPLPDGLMDRLMPRDRVVSDSRRVIYYYRASPDRRRVLFGGRVSLAETDPTVSAACLYREMTAIFPELDGVRISHSWVGFVAYTFDTLAHTGVHDGVHYAMGYCGSGVSMASWLGMRCGQKVLGLAEGRTAFDGLPFPTRSWYRGRPWFLSASVMCYRWLDRMGL